MRVDRLEGALGGARLGIVLAAGRTGLVAFLDGAIGKRRLGATIVTRGVFARAFGMDMLRTRTIIAAFGAFTVLAPARGVTVKRLLLAEWLLFGALLEEGIGID